VPLETAGGFGGAPIRLFPGVLGGILTCHFASSSIASLDVLDPKDLDDPGQEEVGGRAPAFGLGFKP
jgi:hypothetical protein